MGAGRVPGSKNKRTIDGGIYAGEIIFQTKGDLEVEDPNPVTEKLKKQARAGVGSQEGLLPAAVFVHLVDRHFGKVVDRVKLNVGGRAFEGESAEQLAKRAEVLLDALKGTKEKS